MPGEYLVPVYESNHTYDTYDQIEYDVPDVGKIDKSRVLINAGNPLKPPPKTPKTNGMCTESDDVKRKNKSTKGGADTCCPRCASRCVLVTGAVVVVVCLVLTAVNVLLLISIKHVQDKTEISVYGRNQTWSWGAWGLCSASCGVGIRSRERYCRNKPCVDGAMDKDVCHVEKCPDPSPVGFSASLTSIMENVSKGTTIVYGSVKSNLGQGYDSDTGVFTCPESGAYLFLLFVQGRYSMQPGASDQTSLTLMIDNEHYTSIVSEPVQLGQDETGGNAIVVYLTKGQEAWVETYYEDGQILYSGRTTFSGVLIR